MPIFYGDAELHALDPFVQYRSAKYILDNGIFDFFNWYDDQSWFPYGKNMGTSIYPGTPITGILIFYFLNSIGIPVTLLEACVVEPAILGTLTVIMMYFLGKIIANKKVGLVAALFLMVLPGHLQRTYAGFYDNEALGIFMIVCVLTFFIHSLKTGSIMTGVLSGTCLGILSGGWSSWNYIYALLSLGAFLLVLLNRYSTRLLMSFTLTIGIGWTIGVIVPRNGTNALTGTYGLISLGILGLLTFIELWRRFKASNFYFFSKVSERYNWKRILLYSGIAIFIVIILTASTGILQLVFSDILQTDFIKGFGNRVLAIINPLYVTQATRSVAEHIPSAWSVYYYNFSFILLLVPMGIFFFFRRLHEDDIIMILFGITMIYFASSYIRLQLLLAPAVAIIGAFGLVYLFRPFSLVFKEKFIISRRKKRVSPIVGREIGIALLAFFTWMIMYPTMHGIWNGWANLGRSPGMLDDMKEGYTWMRTVLPQGTVVMSWWDYGYRITTMGEKVTVDDNATSNSTQMGMVGRMFMATDESTAVEICRKYNVSYVMVRWGYYQSYLGGDDGKWQWMLRIASQTLADTRWAIDVASIWSEDQYKVTENFFDTILWKMLVTNEPYIDAERTYSTAQGGSISGSDIINNKGGFYRPFWSRLANPGDSSQYKTVEGNNWDFYNPDPMGSKTSMPLDASTTVVDVDTFPGDSDANDMLKFFDVAFYSKYRIMKVYKVNYEKADLRFDIVDVKLYNNSVVYIEINNTGKRTFDIDEITIGGQVASTNNKITGNGTIDLKNIYPGESILIRSSDFGTINYNETYEVDVKVKDSSITANTLINKIDVTAEKSLYYNMTVPESKLYLFNNNSIIFSVLNTGDDYLVINEIELDSNTGQTFITNDSTNVVAPGELKRFLVDSTTMFPSVTLNIDDTFDNLKITSDSQSNLTAEFYNLTVISHTYCSNIVNLTAWANETIKFNIKNNGLYNLTIDHVRIDNLIWDAYITPNPHNYFIPIGSIQEFEFKTNHEILNLNDSDIVFFNITVNLPVNQTLDNISSKLTGDYVVMNDWIKYNITIQNISSYSNETLIVNLTNTGTNSLTISDFSISTNDTNTWIRTNNFSKILGGNNILAPNESALFKVNSFLNLNYTDYVNISVHTYEGAWGISKNLTFTERTGNVSITWTETYQNNNTVWFNVTNTGINNITVKSVYFNNETAEAFYPINSSYIVQPNSYMTIRPGETQMFKAIIKSSQMPSITPGGELIINITTWEGATDETQVSWAYNMQFTKIYAYLNDTVVIYIKNTGVGTITVNNFYINGTICNWTLVSGSITLNPNEIATFLLNTTYSTNNSINLNFSNIINVMATANYTSTLQNISYNYNNLFVLDTNYNITIVKGWPDTYAFDNGTLIDANDTIYITIMNSGAYNITISDILVNGLLRNFTIVGSSPNNFTISPYQTLKLVNMTNLGIDLNATERVHINVTTNATVLSKLVWDDINLIICYRVFNVSLLYKNNETWVNGSTDQIFLNITNYGNETLTLGENMIFINDTVDFMYYYNIQSGISEITLRPGDTVLISIILTNLGPFIPPDPQIGQKVKVSLSWYVDDIYLDVM